MPHAAGTPLERCRTRPERCRVPPGRLSNALKPGIHGVRTHWIRGFMAFRLARRRSPARSTLRPCRPTRRPQAPTVPYAGSGVLRPEVPLGAGIGSGEDEERSAPMTDRAIRASDKERESVVDVLRDAYTDGRLTLEEFE
ncbi:MAG TPA: DUF1707 domain-containing protein, partial [Streptosporangiaceae bacterium]|nr:DUF1707 domain-containing protein [Streptosporangiaceae bacterium]